MKTEKKIIHERKSVGRPKTSTMQSYHYKADGDLVPYLELYSKGKEKEGESRNGFINAAVREKLVREGWLKNESVTDSQEEI